MNLHLAQYEMSAGTSRQLPAPTLPEIVFAGRSNVGKSSLLNKLLNRKALARVSATPGKTVTINFYKVDTVRFVDFPGYGYAKRPDAERRRWSELAEGYFAQDRNIALIAQLIDIRHPHSKDDDTMLRFLADSGLPFVVVLTKADKLNKTQLAKRLQEIEKEMDFLPPDTVKLPVSSQNGSGIDTLMAQINQAVKVKTTIRILKPKGE
ncbi:MAG: YihA family ribosome biogenesis GTP-binding protein [Clostridia bacterium]|nr:YihA family ribosome biogenesis GTP-binding protein [Clostridia bacterium]